MSPTVIGRAIDLAAPPRLGRGFRLLLGSSLLSNLGDGINLAAGALLVASQTRNPALVALSTLLQRLPWLLFGLHAGVIADRLERRMVILVADLFRVGLLVALTLVIAGGRVNVIIVLVALFLLGTAEVVADVTTGTLLPMIIDDADLGIGNARLMISFTTVNQLAGPPIGAALFTVAIFWPFAGQAVLLGLGASLVWRIVLPAGAPAADEGGSRVRAEIAAGVRWLWAHPPIRTLALTIFAFNVTFGAAFSVLVLYALERLGLGAIGFGLLTTVGAVGGLVGAGSYGRLERRISLADIMRIGLIIETLTHLFLALTTTAWVAMIVLFVFGAHAAVWGTTSHSIRHRAVPTEFQGRVGSVYMICVQGGLVIGAAAGGLIAGRWGVTGPYWFAFVGSAVLLLLIWRELENVAHAEQPAR